MNEMLRVESMEFTADIAGALAEARISALLDALEGLGILVTEIFK